MSRPNVRYVSMALIVCGIVLSTTGIGAFSAVSADRQVVVGVGEKSTSYLGISIDGATVNTGTNGTRSTTTQFSGTQTESRKIVLGTVTNYFKTPLTEIEITVTGDGYAPPTVLTLKVEGESLASGSDKNLVAKISCGSTSRTDTVTLKFKAEGEDTYVETKRTVSITCINATSPSTLYSLKLPSPHRLTISST